MRLSKGFTLLEVIIALAIFSISLLAITRALTQGARSLEHVQDKTFSHWVARNATNAILLNISSGNEGSMRMGEKTYEWQAKTEKGTDPNSIIIHVKSGNSDLTTYSRNS